MLQCYWLLAASKQRKGPVMSFIDQAGPFIRGRSPARERLKAKAVAKSPAMG
jgi:hypothetical protein